MLLNIGLNRGGKEPLASAYVLGLLRIHNVSPQAHGLFASKTEQTLVVKCEELGRYKVYDLAEALEQDCIAVLSEVSGGALIGPHADSWGAFDPAKFIVLNGSTIV